MKKIGFILFSLYPLMLLGNIYQISGIITGNDGQPIPYAHVINLTKKKATSTDYRGLYSIIGESNDSIVFSSIGYKSYFINIPETNRDDQFIYFDLALENDTVAIDEVFIFPWKTYDEFKKAFLALNLEDVNEVNAKKNLEYIKKQVVVSNVSTPGISYKIAMRQQNLAVERRSQALPYIPLLDPFQWAAFIKAISNGEIKDKNKEFKKNYEKEKRAREKNQPFQVESVPNY